MKAREHFVVNYCNLNEKQTVNNERDFFHDRHLNMAGAVEKYQWIFFTGVMTQITCWALHEFLEKHLGLEPKIITSDELRKAAAMKDNPEKSFEINSRFRTQISSQISNLHDHETSSFYID